MIGRKDRLGSRQGNLDPRLGKSHLTSKRRNTDRVDVRYRARPATRSRMFSRSRWRQEGLKRLFGHLKREKGEGRDRYRITIQYSLFFCIYEVISIYRGHMDQLDHSVHDQVSSLSDPAWTTRVPHGPTDQS
jgi:hypothetical protein